MFRRIQNAVRWARPQDADVNVAPSPAPLGHDLSAAALPVRQRESAEVSRLPISEEFHAAFRQVMLDSFYRDNPYIDINDTAVLNADVAAHAEHRFRSFETWIDTWLAPAVPALSSMTALEIGPGTGSSTLAFARRVRQVVSFEIDAQAMVAARARLDYFGQSNVEFHERQFDETSEFCQAGHRVDLVVLCAVLEHMTLQERTATLRAAWRCLRPGGLLVVADTPNRFAALDRHTSLLPFYSALPQDIQAEYAKTAPRRDLRVSMESTAPADVAERLTRWGAGISYHDFEIALGREIHEYILLDGYEPAILDICPDTIDDALLRIAFHHHAPDLSPAFSRSNLYFVATKPA